MMVPKLQTPLSKHKTARTILPTVCNARQAVRFDAITLIKLKALQLVEATSGLGREHRSFEERTLAGNSGRHAKHLIQGLTAITFIIVKLVIISIHLLAWARFGLCLGSCSTRVARAWGNVDMHIHGLLTTSVKHDVHTTGVHNLNTHSTAGKMAEQGCKDVEDDKEDATHDHPKHMAVSKFTEDGTSMLIGHP